MMLRLYRTQKNPDAITVGIFYINAIPYNEAIALFKVSEGRIALVANSSFGK